MCVYIYTCIRPVIVNFISLHRRRLNVGTIGYAGEQQDFSILQKMAEAAKHFSIASYQHASLDLGLALTALVTRLSTTDFWVFKLRLHRFIVGEFAACACLCACACARACARACACACECVRMCVCMCMCVCVCVHVCVQTHTHTRIEKWPVQNHQEIHSHAHICAYDINGSLASTKIELTSADGLSTRTVRPVTRELPTKTLRVCMYIHTCIYLHSESMQEICCSSFPLTSFWVETIWYTYCTDKFSSSDANRL